MRSFTLPILALLHAVPSFAGADSLPVLVARDIQALLSDTVNEGDQTARVLYAGSAPRVSCRVSPATESPAQSWAFCRVDFEVRFEDQSEQRVCGLLYRVDDEANGPVLHRSRYFDSCIEILGESL